MLDAPDAPAAPRDPAAHLSHQRVLDPEGGERLDGPELKTYYVPVNLVRAVHDVLLDSPTGPPKSLSQLHSLNPAP